MSQTYAYGLGPVKKEDMLLITDYVIATTRKQSIADLGHDITDDAKNYPDHEFQGFHIYDNEFVWTDFSGCPRHLDVGKIIRDICTHFPDVIFTRWITIEGPTVYEAIGQNGKWEELKEYRINVYVPNASDFAVLTGNEVTEVLSAIEGVWKVENDGLHWVKIYFKMLVASQQEQAIAAVLGLISAKLPGVELPCLLVGVSDEGEYFESKALLVAGKAEWQEIPTDQHWKLMEVLDLDEGCCLIMNDTVLKELFPERF